MNLTKIVNNTELIQKKSNEILLYIQKICAENNIKFYLAFGTALGAVRHNGFIPWDDDIDIYMRRNDFMLFQSAISKDNSKYKLEYFTLDKDFNSLLPKVIDTTTFLKQKGPRNEKMIGIYVDIFVLDNIPNDFSERKKFIKKFNYYNKLWSFVYYKRNYKFYNPLFYVYFFAKKVVNVSKIVAKSDKLAQKYNNINTGYVSNVMYCENRAKEIFPVSWFLNDKMVQFQNAYYNVPFEVNEYLTLIFGDYMKLPPIEERISHHNFDLYVNGDSTND